MMYEERLERIARKYNNEWQLLNKMIESKESNKLNAEELNKIENILLSIKANMIEAQDIRLYVHEQLAKKNTK